MPRLKPSLFRLAKRQSPHLATLLPACRDLESAANELRWIKNHVDDTSRVNQREDRLIQLCQQRGRGVPLQYVLGSQPFGPLEVKCRPGVLIPRPETEAYTCHLADLIKAGKLLGGREGSRGDGLRILDFCTGTGCIPLLLFSSLQHSFSDLQVRGVDISPKALRLAEENIAYNTGLGRLANPGTRQGLVIARCNVFSDSDIQELSGSPWDILVSNPPYVSREVWNYGRGQLGYSVRKHEPRLALVPDDDLPRPAECDPADVFYARLLDIASLLKTRVILLEVGDRDQALRVLELYAQHNIANGSRAELWRDWPDFDPTADEQTELEIRDSHGQVRRIPVKGSGLTRSIFIRPSGPS